MARKKVESWIERMALVKERLMRVEGNNDHSPIPLMEGPLEKLLFGGPQTQNVVP